VRRAGAASISGLSCAIALLAGASDARAYDSLAVDCGLEPAACQVGGLSFAAQSPNALDLGFDTGWVPASGPLSVHLVAGVYATTDLALDGWLAATWPEAIVLETPGEVDGGRFAIQYGAEVAAEAKISISVLGQSINFTGPIPYVPQFDFVVDEETVFESWAFDPGVTITGETQPATLAQVGIDQIIGTSIPGLDGGFELDASIELAATYVTDRMVLVDPLTGLGVLGGDLFADGALSSFDYVEGPFFEVDVHPEGRVTYEGVLHLVPAFYVEFLGQNFQIPIADIPIPFSTEETWIFDAQRVHVPLPDIDLSSELVDLGEGALETPVYASRPLYNDGEATLVWHAESSHPDVVEVSDDVIEVEPGDEALLAMVFAPLEPGEHHVTITVTSNDPDQPAIELEVVGEATDVPPTVHRPAGGAPPLTMEDGCGCRTAGGPNDPSRAMYGLALLWSFVARRRARASSRDRSATAEG
jgi:MYXO-CTERM domain-containing protein